MKVERKEIPTQPTFKPFELVLSVTSADDARTLYALFNHSHNARLLGEDFCRSVKDSVGGGFTVAYGGRINEHTLYTDFYK